jgi:hypothetical protein
MNTKQFLKETGLSYERFRFLIRKNHNGCKGRRLTPVNKIVTSGKQCEWSDDQVNLIKEILQLEARLENAFKRLRELK